MIVSTIARVWFCLKLFAFILTSEWPMMLISLWDSIWRSWCLWNWQVIIRYYVKSRIWNFCVKYQLTLAGTTGNGVSTVSHTVVYFIIRCKCKCLMVIYRLSHTDRAIVHRMFDPICNFHSLKPRYPPYTDFKYKFTYHGLKVRKSEKYLRWSQYFTFFLFSLQYFDHFYVDFFKAVPYVVVFFVGAIVAFCIMHFKLYEYLPFKEMGM